MALEVLEVFDSIITCLNWKFFPLFPTHCLLASCQALGGEGEWSECFSTVHSSIWQAIEGQKPLTYWEKGFEEKNSNIRQFGSVFCVWLF